MQRKIVLVLSTYLFILGSAHADRTVWYVHPDSALNSIQVALDSCADNDIVLVGPGVYYENIIWPNTQSIHLISELGPDTTIIDGDSVGNAILINAKVDSATVIKGFTIQNAWSEGSGGGGIYCLGVDLDHCSPVIMNNTITGNHIWGMGGGICCVWSSPAIISNTITENEFAGIACYASFSSIIIGNTIIGNAGEGIYCDLSSPVIINNSISQNNGTGVYCWESAPTIKSSIITNNSVGVWMFDSPPTIDSCTISNNNGDGIYCAWSYGSVPKIHYNNITANDGYGIRHVDTMDIVDAQNNWWGDATGPYHPDSNPGGQGDSVSDYVDFIPWLDSPVGVEEQTKRITAKSSDFGATVFSGPLLLPKDKKCKIYDITGREVKSHLLRPGIYFIEIDGVITKKVVKVR